MKLGLPAGLVHVVSEIRLGPRWSGSSGTLGILGLGVRSGFLSLSAFESLFCLVVLRVVAGGR